MRKENCRFERSRTRKCHPQVEGGDREPRLHGLRAQVPRWIPVAERLPSGDNQVLVVVSGKPKENITLAGAVELATLYSDGWCLETWPEWTGAEVTHWMPIPETPEPPEEAGHD